MGKRADRGCLLLLQNTLRASRISLEKGRVGSSPWGVLSVHLGEQGTDATPSTPSRVLLEVTRDTFTCLLAQFWFESSACHTQGCFGAASGSQHQSRRPFWSFLGHPDKVQQSFSIGVYPVEIFWMWILGFPTDKSQGITLRLNWRADWRSPCKCLV